MFLSFDTFKNYPEDFDVQSGSSRALKSEDSFQSSSAEMCQVSSVSLHLQRGRDERERCHCGGRLEKEERQ